jgi:hypothetical protein
MLRYTLEMFFFRNLTQKNFVVEETETYVSHIAN